MSHNPPHKPFGHSEPSEQTSQEPGPGIFEPTMWRLVVPDDRNILIPGSLWYSSADPYAVGITFRVHGDKLDWLFSRSLLIGGLHEPVGTGDVEISPCHSDGMDTVRITLKARYTDAVLEVPARVIAAFLNRTCQAVPIGTEHRHLDLDDLVCRLVQDTG